MSLDNITRVILEDNTLRNETIRAKFNPITGEGSVGERKRIEISDFPIPVQYIPASMMSVPLVRQLVEAGSIEAFYNAQFSSSTPLDASEKEKIIEQFIRPLPGSR